MKNIWNRLVTLDLCLPVTPTDHLCLYIDHSHLSSALHLKNSIYNTSTKQSPASSLRLFLEAGDIEHHMCMIRFWKDNRQKDIQQYHSVATELICECLTNFIEGRNSTQASPIEHWSLRILLGIRFYDCSMRLWFAFCGTKLRKVCKWKLEGRAEPQGISIYQRSLRPAWCLIWIEIK